MKDLPPTTRRLLTAAFLALIVTVTWSTWRTVVALGDLRQARTALQQASDALARRDPRTATDQLDQAHSALDDAKHATSGFPQSVLRHVPVAGSPIAAAHDGARAGQAAVDGGRILATAIAELPMQGKTSVNGKDLSDLHRAALEAAADLRRAEPHFVEAGRILVGPAGASLPPVARRATQMRDVVDQARRRIAGAERALDLVARLTAPDADYRLLAVPLNSLELRPAGGIVGTFGTLTLRHGTITLDRFADVAELPDPDPPKPAPRALAASLGTARYAIENAGWSPDYPTSAAEMRDLYARQGGGNVDGVIAFSEDVLARVLDVIGPTTVAGYSQPAEANGIADRILYETTVKQPADVPRKKFLVDLVKTLFDKVFTLPADQVPQLASSLDAAVGRGQVQLWFAEPELQAALDDTVIGGHLPATGAGGDVTVFAETNLTGSKANRDVTRTIDQRVTRRRDGSLDVAVTVAYRNSGDASTLLNPYYTANLELYVPPDAAVSPTASDDIEDHGVTADGSYRVLVGQAVIEPGGEGRLSFEYVLPASRAPHGRYHLTVVRQVGTERDHLAVHVGGHTIDVPASPRAAVIDVDLSGNPVAEFLRHRWIVQRITRIFG